MTRYPGKMLLCVWLLAVPASAADEFEFGTHLIELGLVERARAHFQRCADDAETSELDRLWCRHGLGLAAKSRALQALAELEQLGGDAAATERAAKLFAQAEEAFSSAANAYLDRQNERILRGQPIEQLPPDQRARFRAFEHHTRLQQAEVLLFHGQVPGLDAERRSELLRDSYSIFDSYAREPNAVPRAVLGRGLASFHMGNLEMALADFNTALADRAYSRPEEHNQILAYKFATLIELRRFGVALRQIEKHQQQSGRKTADMELLRARALFGLGQKKQAYRIATRVARLQGPNAAQAAKLLQQWAGELDQADRAAGEILLADEKFDQGQFDQALELYQKIARQAGTSDLAAEGLYKAGLCQLQLNRPAEAAELFAKAATEHAPAQPAAQAAHLWVLTVGQQYHARRTDEGLSKFLDVLDRVMRLYPKHERLGHWLVLKGSALAEAGRLQQAIVEFDKVPSDSDKHLEALFARGEALASIFYRKLAAGARDAAQHQQKADAALTKAVERIEGTSDPTEAARRAGLQLKARVALARLYGQRGCSDYRKVVEILDGLPARMPTDEPAAHEAASLRLTALVGLGRTGGLQQHVARFVRSKPPRQELNRALVALYNGLLKETEAKDPAAPRRIREISVALVELLEAGGWSARQLYLMGSVLHAADQYDRAVKVFDTLLKAYGAQPEALEHVNAGRIRRADCLRGAGRWREAYGAYTELLEIEGNDRLPSVHSGLAACLTEMKQYDRAIVRWRKAAGMLRSGTLAWREARLQLVETLLRAGRKDQAAAVLELMADLHGRPPTQPLQTAYDDLTRRCGGP